MPSPFPGMDPYLEAQSVRAPAQNSLVNHIHMQLNHCLPAGNFALLEAYESTCADSDVLDQPEVDPMTLAHVSVRASPPQSDVVTLIEILSPSSEHPGADRDHDVACMDDILKSATSLVEIDLLRTGQHTWDRMEPDERAIAELDTRADDLVMTCLAWSRSGADMCPIVITGPLPVIPIPLRENEPDGLLDQQLVLTRSDDGGPDRHGAVDSTHPPDPALDGALDEWCRPLVAPAATS